MIVLPFRAIAPCNGPGQDRINDPQGICETLNTLPTFGFRCDARWVRDFTLTEGYPEVPHTGGLGLWADTSGKHISFGHPVLLLSLLPKGN